MFIFAVKIGFFGLVCMWFSGLSAASLKQAFEELQFLALPHGFHIFRPGVAALREMHTWVL